MFVLVFPSGSIAEIGFASVSLTLGGPSPSITHSYGVIPPTPKRAAPTFLGETIGTHAVGEEVWGPICFDFMRCFPHRTSNVKQSPATSSRESDPPTLGLWWHHPILNPVLVRRLEPAAVQRSRVHD